MSDEVVQVQEDQGLEIGVGDGHRGLSDPVIWIGAAILAGLFVIGVLWALIEVLSLPY